MKFAFAAALFVSAVSASTNAFFQEIQKTAEDTFIAKISWTVTAKAAEGEEFGIQLPFLYDYNGKVDLIYGDTTYAHCDLISKPATVGQMKCKTTAGAQKVGTGAGMIEFNPLRG